MKSSKSTQWRSLDNAAKIFPANSTQTDTKVFRIACELKERIDKDTLQTAVEKTIEEFPIYKSIIRRGLFWYYLETSNLRPVVTEEDIQPCSALFNKSVKNLLFRVSYYKNRINVETYHVLTDGTGALNFMKTLVYYYLVIKHSDELENKNILIDYDASRYERQDDSFKKYYDSNRKIKKTKVIKAHKVKGERIGENRLRIIEGQMSASDVVKLSKSYNTTVTTLLTSILLMSINENRSLSEKRPVFLSIPVNLRNYFKSESARNFFGTINVGYDFRNYPNSLESVIEHVNNSFKDKLTYEKVEGRMNLMISLEKNNFIRFIPLKIKDIALRISSLIAEREYTGALSNVGKIQMPEELKPYIRCFDVFFSTNRIQACVVTYDDVMTFSFTSPFVSTDIQRSFFRTLSSMGIDIQIIASKVEENVGDE